MKAINAINQKLTLWQKNPLHHFLISGVSSSQWSFFLKHFFAKQLFDSHHLIVCDTIETAEIFYESFKKTNHVYFYPGLGHSPYSGILASLDGLGQRIAIIAKIFQDSSPSTVITTIEAAHLLVPPLAFLKENTLTLKIEDIISPNDLAKKLIELGYQSESSVEEPGQFSRKGEVFDIFPIGSEPVRLNYFDDLIESIRQIDPATLRTLCDENIPQINIYPGPLAFVREDFSKNLRSHLLRPTPNQKNLVEIKNDIFRNLSDGQLFYNFPVFAPLFFPESSCLYDLFKDKYITLVNHTELEKNFELYLEEIQEEFSSSFSKNDSEIILPEPDKLYQVSQDYKTNPSILVSPFEQNISIPLESSVHLGVRAIKPVIDEKIRKLHGHFPSEKPAYIKAMFQVLAKELAKGAIVYIGVSSKNSQEEIEFLFKENGSPSMENIHFLNSINSESFFYPSENLFVLSDQDIFGRKFKKSKKVNRSNPDLFAEQIATLKKGDYVIHRDYGIGIYQGLESLTIGEQENDFVVIFYEGQDKVYVPVYRLNLIQKHADAHAQIKIHSLKSKKFSDQKNRAKKAVKKLAFDLIELQAKRKLLGGFSFSPPDHLYKEFELAFPFEETPDQQKAIEDVLQDMENTEAMDRLICGDVGFGKTEVAMRAAFKAVLDKKQVLVLVPTTVLALQHFNSFQERMKDFPVQIDFLSRFKSTKQANETIQLFNEGKVDILVGTHKVLSEKLKAHDLGLIIIDEEHRFGVSHKEKLKVVKASVDTLTLTATPIPRTLQLSFLGLRDLSLIQTAPPKRQAIKTYVIKNDSQTIQQAIEKELSRGGQVFYVHNRVKDIEEVSIKLKKLVPKARICITHGQMPERELEKKINDFYQHKSDILLTTTIIESGIDVPNANTMIIDRADTFGLAQLHQLRGRIGRSDRKAYAYFAVPHERTLSEIASKRLQSLQAYADIGSGFSLATCDLEIRGAGDILGAEQSGQIEAVGLELYMELLEEAIGEMKGKQNPLSINQVEIQTPFNAYIPKEYIKDQGERLKYYKKLSNAANFEILHNTFADIENIFGRPPKELESLYSILESRLYFKMVAIKQIRVAQSTIHLYFDQNILASAPKLRDKLLNKFLERPNYYKVNPDISVVCKLKEKVDQTSLVNFAKEIAHQAGVC